MKYLDRIVPDLAHCKMLKERGLLQDDDDLHWVTHAFNGKKIKPYVSTALLGDYSCHARVVAPRIDRLMEALPELIDVVREDNKWVIAEELQYDTPNWNVLGIDTHLPNAIVKAICQLHDEKGK